MNKFKKQQGFTLIELLVVIGIIAVLAAIVIIAINPARQFAQARDAQRSSDLNAILNGVGQSIADGKGTPCIAVPTTTATIKTGGAVNTIDLACLVPNYIASLPFDPKTSGAHWTSTTDYDTGYTIIKDATSLRITVTAPDTEIATPDIAITR